jgi:hypothetical protein
VIGGWLLAGGVLGTALVGACADKKGALMLAINTDMRAPKDVNAVSVTISTNGAIKHSFIGRVTPQGEVLLPATLAIVEPQDKAATIRIRVMAFQDRKPRVLRDVRTTVPASGRTALLRIPLNFVNDTKLVGPSLPVGIVPDPVPGTGGTTSGGAPTTGGADGGTDDTGGGAFGTSAADFDFMNAFQPPCPNIQDDTVIDGECADNYVDPETLPDFDSADLGDSTDVGTCFDLARCFAGAVGIGESGGTLDGGPPPAGQPDASRTDAEPTPDPCPGGLVCGGLCVNPKSDDNNCGFCGHKCMTAPTGDAGGGPRQQCLQGQCTPLNFKDFRPAAVVLDRDACVLQLNGTNPARLNLALVTPDTGECVRPGECYVPIDRGPNGWQAENGSVQLPKYVCKLLNGTRLRLATSTDTCEAKEEKNPICTPKVGDPIADASVLPNHDGGPIGPATIAIAEDFPTSVAVVNQTLFFASQSRVGQVSLGAPNALPQPLQGVPGGAHVPWRFGFGGGLALANGTDTGYLVSGGGTVKIAANTVAVAPVGGSFIWGVSGTPSGGLFITPPTQAVRLELPPIDVTALLGTKYPNLVIVGDATGGVRACPTDMIGQCGAAASIGSRVDGLVSRDDLSGYALTPSGVFKITVDPANRAASSQLLADSSNPGILENGTAYFARAIASFGPCVAFSSAQGLKLAIEGQGNAAVIVPSVSDKPILGVAIGPDSSGAMAAYYTVFAPRDTNAGMGTNGVRGGGIYSVTLPAQCGGRGSGPPDAGVQPDGGADGQLCGPGNCANGCCTGAGVCLASPSQNQSFCGNSGNPCQSCNAPGGEICQPVGGSGGMCFLP